MRAKRLHAIYASATVCSDTKDNNVWLMTGKEWVMAAHFGMKML